MENAMAFVAAPNIIQVEWRMLLFGQKIENRLMVDNLGVITPAILEAEAIRAWNWWEATYAPNIVNTVTLASVVTTDMGEQNGSQFTYAPDTTTAGALIGQSLPNETAFCISLHTASRGRSARGRWFVAGILDVVRTDPNTISTTAAEAWRASLQNYINTTVEAEKAVVIVSRFSNNAPRVGGPVYFPVTSAAVTDLILDSQRRRKPGFGA
jgi:hypothetical protein